MTTPAGVVHALDLPMDPQLVHDLAKSFDSQIRKKRTKLLRSVQQIGFHTLEDDSGVFAQGIHRDVRLIAARPFDSRVSAL